MSNWAMKKCLFLWQRNFCTPPRNTLIMAFSFFTAYYFLEEGVVVVVVPWVGICSPLSYKTFTDHAAYQYCILVFAAVLTNYLIVRPSHVQWKSSMEDERLIAVFAKELLMGLACKKYGRIIRWMSIRSAFCRLISWYDAVVIK